MEYNGYKGHVEYCHEQRRYVGRVEGFNDPAFTFTAETEEECWKEFFAVIDKYLRQDSNNSQKSKPPQKD